MVIELKITNDMLIQLAELLRLINDVVPLNKESKLLKSIGIEIADKIEVKAVKTIKSATLFNSKKRHKISLRYHQAWALEYILQSSIPSLENPHSRTVMTALLGIINQKIA